MGGRELLRIDARVEVEFKNFDQFHREYTKNISQGGLFIKTPNSLPPQTIVEITLKLPEVEKPLSMVGEVVHVIDPETAKSHGWDPGMGIHFVDFEERDHQYLNEYVNQRHQENPQAESPDRRRHQRVALRLRVRFPSLEVLRHDYSEDIGRGGIFIQTPKAKKIGDRFTVTLVHPDTGQELDLMSEVVRLTRLDPAVPGSVAGMGLRFLEMDEKKIQTIENFLGMEFPAPEK